MAKSSYQERQREYGGLYVALRSDEVVASAESYGELRRRLEDAGIPPRDVIIQYVERPTAIRVY